MNVSSGSPRCRAPGVGTALAVTSVALAAGVVVPLLPRRVRLGANLVAAAATIAVARRRGLTWAGLGCDPADAARGGRYGAAAAGLVAAVVAGSAAHPATRGLYADERVAGAGRARAAYDVLVRIPIATALAEELCFRGAVLGAWDEAAGRAPATAVSSLAFGLWHVIPALESHAHNPAGADLSARLGGRPAHVGVTVVATAAAGAAFAALRLRSRSVLAPVLAHAAVNELAYLAARWAHAPRAATAGAAARQA